MVPTAKEQLESFTSAVKGLEGWVFQTMHDRCVWI